MSTLPGQLASQHTIAYLVVCILAKQWSQTDYKPRFTNVRMPTLRK
jgi:hypothetical protein